MATWMGTLLLASTVRASRSESMPSAESIPAAYESRTSARNTLLLLGERVMSRLVLTCARSALARASRYVMVTARVSINPAWYRARSSASRALSLALSAVVSRAMAVRSRRPRLASRRRTRASKRRWLAVIILRR